MADAKSTPSYSSDLHFLGITIVVSIEFSPLSSVELTNNWYQLHYGDYKGILAFIGHKPTLSTFLLILALFQTFFRTH